MHPTRYRRLLRVAVLAVVLATPALGSAQGTHPTSALLVRGALHKQLVWTAQTLRQVFGAQVREVALTSHGKEERYDAVPLIKVIEYAGIKARTTTNAEMGMAVIARARDGYVVVFGLGELMANTGARDVYLAFEREGQPLPLPQLPMRLIVPADKRAARSAFAVNNIEIVDFTGARPMAPEP